MLALWSVGVAAPLFDLMGENPNFLAFRRMDGVDIAIFTVVLAYGPPLLLFGIEAAVRLISTRAGTACHLVFVAILVALTAVQVFKKLGVDRTTLLVGGAVVAGITAAGFYDRAPPARSFLSALSPAAVLFPMLFLFFSPVTDLVFASDVDVSSARVAGDVPVVMVVFDEVSTVALMDGQQRIDPVVFPNLASLADDSTWFRYATATTDETSTAVPTLLTGSFPRDFDAAVILSQYPRNLFTFLGRSYRMEVSEEASDLCPRTACNDLTRGNLTSRVRSLASDTSLIYLHLIAPPKEERDLPSVSETLGDFGAETEQTKLSGSQIGTALGTLVGRRPQRFLTLVGAIRPGRAPALYFKHSLLPHVPFEYLQSGRRYWGSTDPIPGLYGEPSWGIPYLRRQAYQRHLLQMQFGDFLLGKALQRLRDLHLYERALIVVTSDGGESFLHAADRNKVTTENVEDIAATPLLIKAPGETRGRVVDRHVRTMDVLPTIAALLDARLPWRVQGSSVWDSSSGVPRRVRVVDQSGKPVVLGFGDFKRRVRASVERKLRVFGPHGERLFRVGFRPELLDRSVATFAVTQGHATVAQLNDAEAYADVDLSSGFVPALITGSVEGPPAPGRELAVAVNGRIAGVAPTFKLSGSESEEFSILVSDRAFQDGRNTVQVLLVKGEGRDPLLERIGGTG